MTKRNITILGAGLVGSLTAILLKQRGYEVSIFERRPDARKTDIYAGRSINLAMSTRGWHALEKAGLKDAMNAIAIPMYGREIHAIDGNIVFQPYGKNNEAIYSVSRGELNKFLIDEAEKLGVQINFESKCTYTDIASNTITIEDLEGTKNIKVDLLIGSDGAFSSLRNAYAFADKTDYQHFYIGHGYKELHIPAAENNGYLMKKEALHIWPRKNYMLIALPNMDGSFTLTLFFPYEGEPSFKSLLTDEEIIAFFKEQFDDAITLMPNYLNDYKTNPTSSLVTVKINKWTHLDKSLLIGDAAHAIVPFYGQGMNAGFEDATTLANIIDKYKGENWTSILDEYAASRIKNGYAVAQLALNNFIEMRDLVADPAFIERKKIEKELGLRYPNEYLSVYEMVSFSHTPYAVALATTEAQHELYQTIINNTTNFWEQLNDDNYIAQLSIWVKQYSVKANNILANA
jgi:kynurenine 3-monooxygenase